MALFAHLPGLAVALGIALAANGLSFVHSSFDALVVSILAGMGIGNAVAHAERFEPGIETAVRFLLPAGIALYGARLGIRELGWPELIRASLVCAGLFGMTFFLARLFGVSRTLTTLLSSGLAICGASAIAVLSPLVSARREEMSISIISVMMVGLLGVILYPILGDLLVLTEDDFGFFAGATLPMIGQVKLTAGAVGARCLEYAMNIKLIRVSFLFVLVAAATLISGTGEQRIRVPWFVIGFIVLAAAVNFASPPAQVVAQVRFLSTFCLAAGLAATGFTVSFGAIIDEGFRPFGILFLSWCVIVLGLYLIKNVL
ncbi:MAG: putative sulfate exporter family transporter [Thermodesulfovibrionales bacterium]